MKLHTFNAPNPFRVHVFMVEKGIEIPLEKVDLMRGAHREPAFLAKNALGEVPVLELDDGSFLPESVAICRHLEALHPTPALFGATPQAAARVEMWSRRIELQLFETIGAVARNRLPFFAAFLEQVPAYADAQERMMAEKWRWLDAELADGRTYLCDDAFSIADITGMAALMVSDFTEIGIPADAPNAARWAATVRARPSWEKARALLPAEPPAD